MKPPVLRLVLSAVLFAAWLGYLLYLVVTLPHSPNGLPIVLSKPQLLTSDYDVIGLIDLKDGTVKVEKVLFARGDSEPKVDASIQVTNLETCEPPLRAQTNLGPCLLPLRKIKDLDAYEIVPVPPSPGFAGGAPRVYPATSATEAEYRAIHKQAG